MASSCLVVASAFVIGLLVIPSVQAQPPSPSLSLSEESTYAGERFDEEGSVALGEQAAWCEMNSDSEECQMRVDLLQRNVDMRMISSKQGAYAEAKIVEHAEDESVSNSTSTSYYLIENDHEGDCLEAQGTNDGDAANFKQTCSDSDDMQKWTISSSGSQCKFCLYAYPDICLDGDRYEFVDTIYLRDDTATRRRMSNSMFKLCGPTRRRSARRRENIKLWMKWSGYGSQVWGVEVSSNKLYSATNSARNYYNGGANLRFWINGDPDDKLDSSELSGLGCYNEAYEDYD